MQGILWIYRYLKVFIIVSHFLSNVSSFASSPMVPRSKKGSFVTFRS